MTVQEFSDQFDFLYNNITSNQAPGLNEWEKSVALTKGQEELVKNYFNPKSNPKQDGFDDSAKRQADFSTLIRTYLEEHIGNSHSFDQRSNTVLMPSDIFISLNEQVMDGKTPLTVVPISYDEYNRLMSKPYKYPPKYQVWRLIVGRTEGHPGSAEYEVYSTLEKGRIYFDNYNKYAITLVVEKYSGTDPEHPNYKIEEDAEGNKIITCYIPAGQGGCFTWYWNNVINAPIGAELKELLHNLVWPEDTIVEFYSLPTTICDITAEAMEGGEASVAELIGKFSSDAAYRVRYIKRPRPIILTNLHDISNELSINGQWEEMTSELPEELHEEILQRAVELAKVAWQGDVKTTVEAGYRSE